MMGNHVRQENDVPASPVPNRCFQKTRRGDSLSEIE
jgi:hypothetical protein